VKFSFKDWLLAQEDSPFDRMRLAAAKGLGPDIPDAEINSRSTAPPWQADCLAKRHGHKGHKCKVKVKKHHYDMPPA
jgi:hypothetical protein